MPHIEKIYSQTKTFPYKGLILIDQFLWQLLLWWYTCIGWKKTCAKFQTENINIMYMYINIQTDGHG